MKKHFALILLLFSSVLFAQNNNTKKSKELEFMVNGRIQALYPIPFGDNALAKAHKPRLGFSGQLNLLDFQNFKAGLGIDFVTYDITDKMLIANKNTSKYTSYYLLISYEYKPSKKIYINPNIGWGSASLDIDSRNSRFGGQSGSEFRIGGILDYKIGKSTYVFGGINYVINKFDIETSPEYKSFFSKANQIQLSLGLRLGN